MINTTKSIKETLQSLLEQGYVDETFVEDVRDAFLFEAIYKDVPELFEGTLEALETLEIDVNKMRAGTYYKQ